MIAEILDFLDLISNSCSGVTCNRCGCRTPYKKAVKDSGYDDWGYQCIACATDSGLLMEVKKKEAWHKHQLERRKEFGL